MKHECEICKLKHFDIEIHKYGDENYQYLYDRRTHQYVHGIIYCPFCGTNLRTARNEPVMTGWSVHY